MHDREMLKVEMPRLGKVHTMNDSDFISSELSTDVIGCDLTLVN